MDKQRKYPEVIKDEDKTPEMLMELFGLTHAEAVEMLAIERGEVSGDMVELAEPDDSSG